MNEYNTSINDLSIFLDFIGDDETCFIFPVRDPINK